MASVIQSLTIYQSRQDGFAEFSGSINQKHTFVIKTEQFQTFGTLGTLGTYLLKLKQLDGHAFNF